MTAADLATYSAVGNVAAVVALAGLGYIVARQARRIARLNVKLHEQREAGIHQTLELGEVLARNDELEVDNDQLAADLTDLREENVALLRSMVTGEAS